MYRLIMDDFWVTASHKISTEKVVAEVTIPLLQLHLSMLNFTFFSLSEHKILSNVRTRQKENYLKVNISFESILNDVICCFAARLKFHLKN